jgi:hypothetical protein
VDDYNFYLLWSFSPTDGFHFVTDSSGTTVVIDGAVGPLHHIHYVKHTPHNREQYYKIRAQKKTDPAAYRDFPVLSMNDKTDGVIETIAYAEYMLNQYYIGDPVYVLKRKTDGGRCPECWNVYQFRRMKTHCSLCHGTGFYDGFYAAFEMNVSFDANPKIAEMNLTGEIMTTTVNARMGSFPLMSPRDMIVNKLTNARFSVTKIDQTKLPNMALGRGQPSDASHIISQVLYLAELPPDDDKYNALLLIGDIRSYESNPTSKPPVLSGAGRAMPYKKGKFIAQPAIISGSGNIT